MIATKEQDKERKRSKSHNIRDINTVYPIKRDKSPFIVEEQYNSPQ